MASAAPATQYTHQLTTWNSQGSPGSKATADEKMKVLTGLLSKTLRNVVFLQEGGAGLDSNKALTTAFDIFAGVQVGSLNDRCTAYLLIDKAAGAKAVTLTDAKGAALVAGGDAGRTAAAAAVGRTLFVSWHATANSATASTVTLLAALWQNQALAAQYDTIVIGGDFNAVPDDMAASIGTLKGVNRGGPSSYSLRAATGLYAIDIYKTGKATQGGAAKDRLELDYFIVLTSLKQPRFTPAAPAAILAPVDPSDHNPVQMTCRLAS